MNAFRGLGVLFSGNIIVQLLSFLVMPFVTRIYSPDSLGLYQYIIAFALISSPFIGFSFDQAIIKERNNHKLSKIISAAILIAFFSSLVFTAIFFFYNNLFDSNISVFLYDYLIVFLLMFLGANFGFLQAVFLRDRKYIAHTNGSVLFSVVSNSSKVGFGYISPNSSSILLSLCFGYVVYIYILFKFNAVKIFEFIRLKEAFNVFLGQKKFTVYLSSSQFISILINWHIVLVAPFFASASEIGIIALALMITKTPSHPFLASIANITYTEGIKKGLEKSYFNLLFKLSLFGGLCMLMVLLLIYLYGIQVIGFVFGGEWVEASSFAFLFSIPILFSFVFYPANYSIANIADKQDLMLIIDILSLPFFALIAFLAIFHDIGVYVFVLFSSVFMSFIILLKFLSVYIYVFKISKK